MSSFVRQVLARSLMAGAVALAFMMASAAVVRAQTVIGADGNPGDDCFTDGCQAGNGDDGQPASSDGNSATAVGGNGGAGGIAYSAGGIDGFGGSGGGATATSSVLSNGSSKAVSTATAGGGNAGAGAYHGVGAVNGGNASATSHATANGSGDAVSFATASGGDPADVFGDNGTANASSIAVAKGSGGASASAIASIPGINAGAGASSDAETAEGGLAQAESQMSVLGCCFPVSMSATAKTTYNGVSAESTVEGGGGGGVVSFEAVAQGGSGQFPDNPEQSSFAFSTALPNAAYATSLIGSASKVADALLGPDDTIFGTTILAGGIGDASSTFDFSSRGDLLLGVVAGGFVSVILNGAYVLNESVGDNTVINLGSIFGPNIDLTIAGEGTFAVGGAVPEPSTWAMMLFGFAGLGYARHRARRSAFAA